MNAIFAYGLAVFIATLIVNIYLGFTTYKIVLASNCRREAVHIVYLMNIVFGILYAYGIWATIGMFYLMPRIQDLYTTMSLSILFGYLLIFAIWWISKRMILRKYFAG